LHSAEQHFVAAQDKLKVFRFDLLAPAVGRAEGGVVAGFDYEVGEDFVEGGDRVWERWRVVAEGYEEGGDLRLLGWVAWGAGSCSYGHLS
jgi:hypothetical protein